MENNVYIYGLKDPRDYQIKYICYTVDIDRRYKQHIGNITKKKSLKNNFNEDGTKR